MNKYICHGRLTRDIELKDLGNDKKVANFSIAIKRDYKNQNGEYESDFFNCSAFGKTSEFISQYFKKGSEILIIGHLQNNQWETESGEKRTATNIIVENVEFCGNKQNNTDSNNNFESTMQQNGVQVNTTSDDLPF
jgi:single-strand DNA-binding protein